MDQMLVSSQIYMLKSSAAHVLVLGGEAFGRGVGREGGARMEGIRELAHSLPSTVCGYSKKMAACKPGSVPSPDMGSARISNLNFSASRTA